VSRVKKHGKSLLVVAFLLVGAALSGCALLAPKDRHVVATEKGEASYYAHAFHGRRTASGERFNMHDLTAAHRKLPMGTRVRVTNLKNKRQVVVRINDRGPFHRRRIIDVSYEAARKLDMIRDGVAPVKVEVLRN
jgi:rare lipoprotein A